MNWKLWSGILNSTCRVGGGGVWTDNKEQYYSMPENPCPHDLNDSSNVEWRRRYGHGSQSSCIRHLFEFTFMLFFLAFIYHTWRIVMLFMWNLLFLYFGSFFIIQPNKLYNNVIILLLRGNCHQISYRNCNKCGHIHPFFVIGLPLPLPFLYHSTTTVV